MGTLIVSLTALLARDRMGTGVAIAAIALILSGNVINLIAPSFFSVQLAHVGTLIGLVVVGIVVGRAVLSPGPINTHRVLGAIVVYLNFGLIAAAIYRVIWDFIRLLFMGLPPMPLRRRRAAPWSTIVL